jgi:hypothetical protein
VGYLDDAGLHDLACETAEWTFYAFNRYPVDSSFGTGGVKTSVTGQSVGPYPGIETVLRALNDDLVSGRLKLVRDDDEWTSPRFANQDRRPRTDVVCPESQLAYDGERLALALRGVLTDGTLRLTLTNEGTSPISLNPVALRYGRGEWTTTTIESADGKRSYTNLMLELGLVRARAAVPASALLVLAPGSAHAWSVAVRPEHRGADHISVQLLPIIAVVGAVDASFVGDFPETWGK